jgi:hypothetical protein
MGCSHEKYNVGILVYYIQHWELLNTADIKCFLSNTLNFMTPTLKQEFEEQIEDIKASIETEVQLLDGFNDELGQRFIPTQLYLQMEDYTAGLDYLRWYLKVVPGDVGAPDFLFEWTVILFMNGKIKEAERKAVETFFNNTYIFDKFFGRELIQIDKVESWNAEKPEYLADFKYSSTQPKMAAFTQWLTEFEESDKFQSIYKRYIAALVRLKYEDDPEIREYLFKIDNQLMRELDD